MGMSVHPPVHPVPNEILSMGDSAPPKNRWNDGFRVGRKFVHPQYHTQFLSQSKLVCQGLDLRACHRLLDRLIDGAKSPKKTDPSFWRGSQKSQKGWWASCWFPSKTTTHTQIFPGPEGPLNSGMSILVDAPIQWEKILGPGLFKISSRPVRNDPFCDTTERA